VLPLHFIITQLLILNLVNEELAEELVKEIGGGKTKFFQTDVLETESIAAAVKGTLAWSKETGNEIGGVITAAGVSTPAKVCNYAPYLLCSLDSVMPCWLRIIPDVESLRLDQSSYVNFSKIDI